MITQQLTQPSNSKPTRPSNRRIVAALEISTGHRLAWLRGDIVALKREGVVALSRWYRYRKAVRELSRLEDRALDEIGVDRTEIDIAAYCLAEQGVSARPRRESEPNRVQDR